jgi:hypothetical protein
MPICVRCSDGSIVCSNPAPSCGERGLPTGDTLTGPPVTERVGDFERLTVDVSDGRLRLTSDPALSFGTPSQVVIEYGVTGPVLIRIT